MSTIIILQMSLAMTNVSLVQKKLFTLQIILALKPQRVVQIACGRAHTLAATEIGCVFAWGHNGDGQLGTGTYEDKDSPLEILKLPTVPVQLAAGSSHSLLLTDKGEIYVWGSNKEGQLGCEGDVKLTPTILVMGNKISSISCGYYHTLAISVDGQLITWGEMQHGKLGLEEKQLVYQRHPQSVRFHEKVAMAVAGSEHSLILTESGNLFSCGLGSNGQIGQGVMSLEQHSFTPIAEGEELKFVYISAGDNHSAAISEDGLVYTWGCGRHGKLCLGEQNFSSHFSPVLVSRLKHLTAVQVECGGCHTMVLGYRRSELVRKISGGTSLIKEVKAIKERKKETILPTVPISNLKEENEQEENIQDSTLPPLQDNFLRDREEEDGRRKSLESFEVMKESHKKASLFARFWSSFIRRETATTSYQSEEDTKSKEKEGGFYGNVDEKEEEQIEASKDIKEDNKTASEETREEEGFEREETMKVERDETLKWVEESPPRPNAIVAVRSRACVLL